MYSGNYIASVGMITRSIDFVTQDEINDYQQVENTLYDNSTIRTFLYAQREFSQLHNLISQYFTKTIEFDRLPEPSELKKGGCGCGGSYGCG